MRFFIILSLALSCATVRLPANPTLPAEELEGAVKATAAYQAGQSTEPLRRLEEYSRQAVSHPELRAPLEDSLIRLLQPGTTWEAKLFACRQLGFWGSEKALPELTALLVDPSTTSLACFALSTYPVGKADTILRNSLVLAAPPAAIQILNTMGDRRSPKSIPLLAQFSSHPDPKVAEAAIAALSKQGTTTVWRHIERLADHTEPHLQPALREAKLRCAGELADNGHYRTARRVYEPMLVSAELYSRRAALEGLLRLDRDGGEKRILNVLNGLDEDLKPVALARVRSLESRKASERFGALLPNLPPRQQVWLIESLTERGDAAAYAALAGQLDSPNEVTRVSAVAGLSRMGGPATVPLLAARFEQVSDPQERRALQTALVSLPGGSETDRSLIQTMQSATGATRAELVDLVARRQGQEANALLLSELNDRDARVVKAALKALARTGAETEVAPVLHWFSEIPEATLIPEAEHASARMLVRISDPEKRLEPVRGALGAAKTTEVRASMVALLPESGTTPALALLESFLEDPNAEIREAAVRTMADWPSPAAWGALLVQFDTLADRALQTTVLQGLLRLASEDHANPATVARFRQLTARSRGEADLKMILGAMGGAASPETLEMALSYLSQPSVHTEAKATVKRIAEAIKEKHPELTKSALDRIK